MSELSTNGGQNVCVGLYTVLSMVVVVVVGTSTGSGITERVASRSATFTASTELLSGDIYESSENISLSDISLLLLGVRIAWWFPVMAE